MDRLVRRWPGRMIIVRLNRDAKFTKFTKSTPSRAFLSAPMLEINGGFLKKSGRAERSFALLR
jgi:hypothetical protein